MNPWTSDNIVIFCLLAVNRFLLSVRSAKCGNRYTAAQTVCLSVCHVVISSQQRHLRSSLCGSPSFRHCCGNSNSKDIIPSKSVLYRYPHSGIWKAWENEYPCCRQAARLYAARCYDISLANRMARSRLPTKFIGFNLRPNRHKKAKFLQFLLVKHADAKPGYNIVPTMQ